MKREEKKPKYFAPVTVQRTSFTVVHTYFFFNGKLHVILNKLHNLSSDQYDSTGTAKMVIKTLCETLGVSESKLSRLLRHFIYDGVYADIEERVKGGGSLELKKNVCELLGLEPGEMVDCLRQGTTLTQQ